MSRNGQIIAMRESGVGPREIARRLGLTPSVVAGVLHRAGLCILPMGRGSAATPAFRAFVTNRAALTSRYEAARFYGVDWATASLWCREASRGAPPKLGGIPPDPLDEGWGAMGGQNTNRVALDPVWVRDCLAAGDTPEQVAAWGGVSVREVESIAAPRSERERPVRKVSAPKPNRNRERDEAIVAAYRDNVPGPEITRISGLTKQRVYQIVNAAIAAGAVERRKLVMPPKTAEQRAKRASMPRWASPFWIENDAVLRAGADHGMTASEVAEHLGVSRSTVLGRAHRLGVKFAPPKERIAQRSSARAIRAWADEKRRADRIASGRETRERHRQAMVGP